MADDDTDEPVTAEQARAELLAYRRAIAQACRDAAADREAKGEQS